MSGNSVFEESLIINETAINMPVNQDTYYPNYNYNYGFTQNHGYPMAFSASVSPGRHTLLPKEETYNPLKLPRYETYEPLDK